MGIGCGRLLRRFDVTGNESNRLNAKRCRGAFAIQRQEHRGVGPERVGDFGLRTEVDVTDARNDLGAVDLAETELRTCGSWVRAVLRNRMDIETGFARSGILFRRRDPAFQ